MTINELKVFAREECDCKVFGNYFYFDAKNYLKAPLFRETLKTHSIIFKEKLKSGRLVFMVNT